MAYTIRKAAVLGSGVMGSGIAAHLANIGIPTLLLDIVPTQLTPEEEAKGLTLQSKAVRNRIVTSSVEKMKKQKPAPLTHKKSLELITVGNFEDDWNQLADVDWIIEVVVERLDIKQQVFQKIDAIRQPNCIVTTNTSGISVEAMSAHCSDSFKSHFLGTHFFNPPRYLKLLEIIPTTHTSQDVLQFIKQFSENVLGKGVVVAKDTPNFIANRIGTYGLLVTVREMQKHGLTVSEVDSLTGTLIGRPKSATFRTLDVVGLDTFMHVANNGYASGNVAEKAVFDLPNFMQTMLENKWLGSKSGQGFYLKKGKEILQLNMDTLTYEPTTKVKAPSLELAKQEKGLKNKVRFLAHSQDRVGQFLWDSLSPVLAYAANLLGEIADDIVAIDQAMKWGFGWELGPFELWDALNFEKTYKRLQNDGITLPQWIHTMASTGITSFYREEQGETFYWNKEEYVKVQRNEKELSLRAIKEKGSVLKKNSGASLIDIGDGVLLLEFHSNNNAIGLDIISMLNSAIDEVETNDYKGLVIGNEGKNFCVGANLAMILMEAQDDNYFEVEWVVKQFQNAMTRIKYSKKPVVAAPFGMTLGGGIEICLPAARIQASYETYLGLVEAGVGLIPGGGGTKELYCNYLNSLPKGVEIDLQNVAKTVFETIAMAKVSTSGHEAFENGYLTEGDRLSINGSHLIYDAKQCVLDLNRQGYQPPVRRKIPVTGEQGYATLSLGALSMFYSGYISEHDLKIAKKLAWVVAGGDVPFGTEVDEQYLLDLEREAFLSLVQEPKSQQRMQNMLVKGKPLRN